MLSKIFEMEHVKPVPIRSGELGEYAKFYSPNNIPTVDLLDYEKEESAGLALGLSSLKSSRCFVLFFGIPGCGKTKFPFYLCRKLNAQSTEKFSLLHVQCDPLSTSTKSTKDIIRVLDSKTRLAFQNPPTIIVLDEIDSMTTVIADSGGRASMLTRWIRGFVEQSPEKALSVGTTNNPKKMDFSILRRVRMSLFFDVTPPEVIAQIIERSLSRSDAKTICEGLYKRLDANDFIPLASDVDRACEELKGRHKDLQTISGDDLSKRLAALTPGLEKETIENYRETNLHLINRSSDQLDYWAEEYERLTSQK